MEIKTLPWYKKVWLNIDNVCKLNIIPFAFRPRHAMASDMDLDAKNAPASRRRNLWPRLLDKVQQLRYFFNKLVLHEDFPATMHHLR